MFKVFTSTERTQVKLATPSVRSGCGDSDELTFSKMSDGARWERDAFRKNELDRAPGPSSQVERARRAVWIEDHVWPLDGQCPTGGHVRNAPLEVFVLGVVLALHR